MENEPVKILLVEDNVDQRELTLRAFQKKEPDIRITPVETGPACLEALGKGRFDAVILDYSLPMMNGIEVLSEIQTKGYTAPVIMVTGQGDEKIAVEAMKRGACDYIIKSQNYHQTLPPAARKVIDQNRLKRRLEKNAQRVHRLYELSLSLATERKTTVLSDTLVEGAKELMDAEGALLFLIDAEQGEILQTAFAGVSFEGGIPQGPLSKLGLFGLACQEKRPILIEDPQKHPLKGATPALQTPLRQIFSIPLVREARNLGVLNLINQKQGSFSSEDRDFLSTLCVNAAVALDNARFLEEVEKRAATDSLTGLYNHREFQKRLGEETERASRYGKRFRC